MRIRMMRTERGCDDGYTVVTYKEGEEYVVGKSLGRSFIAGGAAERVKKADTKAKGRDDKSRKVEENKDESSIGGEGIRTPTDSGRGEETP